MQEYLFQNDFVTIYKENSHIPWLKIFTTKPYKEFADCPRELKDKLYLCMEIVEKLMIDYYCPIKINIAMFGNYVPHLHIHIMARFENDAFFPESMWGKQQREPNVALPSEEPFLKELIRILKENI